MRINLTLFRGIILLMALLLLETHVRAQEEHVYLVKMFDCAHKPVERSQTGFRVRGEKGLVTALHGVADCQRVTATNKKGLFLGRPLTIRKIDADSDVALLSSPELDSAQDEGLEVANSVVWESWKEVTVYGHPYGIGNLETKLILRNPPLKELKDLLTTQPLSILKDRRSPNHRIKVLNLQGNLLPGHSGAPILDARGRVVAVANGGLKEGFAGISWAVPFQDIELGNANLSDRLKGLAQLDPSLLFAADALPAVPLEEVRATFCRQLSILVVESRTGFISLVGDPIGDSPPPAFDSKIKLQGALYSIVFPNSRISNSMYDAKKREWVESRYYNLAAEVTACFPSWERKESIWGSGPYRSYLFRQNAKSTTIEVYYNLEASKSGSPYTLFLTVHALSEDLHIKWN